MPDEKEPLDDSQFFHSETTLVEWSRVLRSGRRREAVRFVLVTNQVCKPEDLPPGITGLSYRMLTTPYYCGYCIFPSNPRPRKPRTGGPLDLVEVHGGVTLAETLADGQVMFGFDCSHAGDMDNSKLKDIGYLRRQCENMARGIIELARLERRLPKTAGAKGRREIDRYLKRIKARVAPYNLWGNYGMMIRLFAPSVNTRERGDG